MEQQANKEAELQRLLVEETKKVFWLERVRKLDETAQQILDEYGLKVQQHRIHKNRISGDVILPWQVESQPISVMFKYHVNDPYSGVNEYIQPEQALPGACHDLIAVYRVFRQLGFQVRVAVFNPGDDGVLEIVIAQDGSLQAYLAVDIAEYEREDQEN